MTSWQERARVAAAARRHAGLTAQGLMRRLPRGVVLTEADVMRLESGDHCITEEDVRAVLRTCGLPEDWRGES